MCKNTKNVTRRLLSIIVSLTMTFSLFCYAEGTSENTVGSASIFSYKSAKQQAKLHEEAESLPTHFDLRDVDGKNYVTPVKLQNPWGSCWSFAATAAAETSLLYEYGVEAKDNNEINLSEKALAWYALQKITDKDVCNNVPASQIGEGAEVDTSRDINAAYNMGGVPFYASQLYAAGIGPKYEFYTFQDEENQHPYAYSGMHGWTDFDLFTNPELKDVVKEYYVSKKGTEEGFEEYYTQNNESIKKRTSDGTGIGYSAIDDWTLPNDAEHRMNYNIEILQESRILPSPAKRIRNGITEIYDCFDQAGVDAIKKEICAGRPVSIGYKADMSLPGQEPSQDEESYMNTETWSQYTCDDLTLDHSVCIIGYDDEYSKENFLTGTSKATGESKTPPADGAFIVKNSWGSIEDQSEGKRNKGNWGIEGKGYFYLSYYDKTIDMCESFDFFTTRDEDSLSSGMEYYVNQYDFMPMQGVNSKIMPEMAKMSNVFTAEHNQRLVHISTETAKPSTEVTYEIYKLKEDYTSPEDGELLEKGMETFEFGGYHNISLKGAYPLKKGTHFSIVCTQKVPDDTSETGFSFETLFNFIISDVPGIGATAHITGIVNPGESFSYENGAWADFTNEINEIKQQLEEGTDIDAQIDNYSIKAYSVPASCDDFDSAMAIDDPSLFLQATVKENAKSKKSVVNLKWKNVEGATYEIYEAPCGANTVPVKIADTKKKSYKINNLEWGSHHQFTVKAVIGEKIVKESLGVHIVAGSDTETNVKSIKAKKVKVAIGATSQINATMVLQNKGKKLGEGHTKKFRYYVKNPSVATVNEKGEVTGITKGKTAVYIIAINGVMKKVTVNVK